MRAVCDSGDSKRLLLENSENLKKLIGASEISIVDSFDGPAQITELGTVYIDAGASAADGEDLKRLEKELEKAQQSVKESADNFLRLAAEYDNFRKRSLREKDDIKVRSKTDVVEKLLPVIDNFERAALNAEADAESYRKGVEQIYRQFGDILKALDIEAFGAEGDAFDPNIHSAVMHTEDENVGENVIVKVFTKGYKLGDTVIRPAVVQVAN